MSVDKLRYVMFTNNEVAELMATKMYPVYQDAFVGVCMANGLYPLSPKDIVGYINSNCLVEDCAIVECWMPFKSLGAFKEIADKDIISVNKCIGNGVYAPIRKSSRSCAFSEITDTSKDELGWLHPMGGLSYLRNRQCMLPAAYNEMLDKLANRQGRLVTECIDKCLCDYVITERIIEEYDL